MRSVGIDPGKVGGLALLADGEHPAEIMPIIGKDINCRELVRILTEWKPDIVVVESVAAMPKQGVTSVFTFGKGFGMILGVLEGMNISYRLVKPQEWKGLVLHGTAKDKDAAVQFVHRAYPDVNLMPGKKRTPHDGIADAVCLAEYGIRKFTF
jgi:crossover junction endodeoxyribonuclease RuvC